MTGEKEKERAAGLPGKNHGDAESTSLAHAAKGGQTGVSAPLLAGDADFLRGVADGLIAALDPEAYFLVRAGGFGKG